MSGLGADTRPVSDTSRLAAFGFGIRPYSDWREYRRPKAVPSMRRARDELVRFRSVRRILWKMMVELEHPLESLAAVMAFSTLREGQSSDCPVIDWLSDPRLAWIWGVVHGFGPEDKDWYKVANTIGWDDPTLARLRRLHQKFQLLRRSRTFRRILYCGSPPHSVDLGDLS